MATSSSPPSPAIPEYAELRCLSNFSFLRGASHPEELVVRAKHQGYAALAITDECSKAGVVRAHVAAKEHGLKLLIGSQFQVETPQDGELCPFTLVVLACHADGYGNLCEFITQLRRASEKKGTYRLRLRDIDPPALAGCLVLVSPERRGSSAQLLAVARWMLGNFTRPLASFARLQVASVAQ